MQLRFLMLMASGFMLSAAGCGEPASYTEEEARQECRKALEIHGQDTSEETSGLELAAVQYHGDSRRWLCSFSGARGHELSIILDPARGTFEVTRPRNAQPN